MGKRGNDGIYSPEFTESGLLSPEFTMFRFIRLQARGRSCCEGDRVDWRPLGVEGLCQGSSLGTNLEVPKAP